MAFADPEMMVNEYLEEERRRISLDEYIEEELERYKQQAIKLLYMLSNSGFAETIGASIAFGFVNQLPESIKIAKECDLNDKHIAALNGDARQLFDLLSEEAYQEKFYI